jgi:glycerophosphoryl diester phosphodiesterase
MNPFRKRHPFHCRAGWFALWIAFAAVAVDAPAVEIIGHRGASADAPENTLASMRLAWEHGADAIELDLWLSRDGRLIVFHDADTGRFEKPARRTSSLSLEEARRIDVGTWKGAAFAGEPIPTLDSILAGIPKGRRAVLEIKCGPEIVPELTRVLQSSGRDPRELAIISFRWDSLVASKKSLSRIPHYFLHDYSKDGRTGACPDITPMIRDVKAAGLDGLDLHHGWPITPGFVKAIHDEGLQLVVWTVDDLAVARRLTAAGVDGITTNKPRWMREHLGSAVEGRR